MKEPAQDLPGVHAGLVDIVCQDLGPTLSGLFIPPAAFETECGGRDTTTFLRGGGRPFLLTSVALKASEGGHSSL